MAKWGTDYGNSEKDNAIIARKQLQTQVGKHKKNRIQRGFELA